MPAGYLGHRRRGNSSLPFVCRQAATSDSLATTQGPRGGTSAGFRWSVIPPTATGRQLAWLMNLEAEPSAQEIQDHLEPTASYEISVGQRTGRVEEILGPASGLRRSFWPERGGPDEWRWP